VYAVQNTLIAHAAMRLDSAREVLRLVVSAVSTTLAWPVYEFGWSYIDCAWAAYEQASTPDSA
jgi:hypothetical protein